MKLLFKFILFLFYFRSLPFCFIDPNVKGYFNEEYIKEIEKYFNNPKSATDYFYLFEVDDKSVDFKVEDPDVKNGKFDCTRYRSKNKIKCLLYDTENKKDNIQDNKYVDIILITDFFDEKLLCVDNEKDDPKKIYKDGRLFYENNKYILSLEDDLPILFKLKVKDPVPDPDPSKKKYIEKDIIVFCSRPNPLMFYRFADDGNKDDKFDSGKISMFNSERITEFHLINPLITIERLEAACKHSDKKRVKNDLPDEDNLEENDYKNRYYYDDDDKGTNAEVVYQYLFRNCLNLKKISFDENSFTNTFKNYIKFCSNDIFQGCKNLEYIGIKNIYFTNFHFFRDYPYLKSLELYYENPKHQYSFANCENLKEIKFVDLYGNEKVIDEMKLSNAGFKNCHELQYIGAKKIIIDSQWGNTRIFENCKNLKIPDVVVLLHKDIKLEYPNLKNIFKDLDPNLNKDVKLEFKYVDDSSKIRYNLDFNTIFNGCDSKKNIEITSVDGQKQILKDVQNNDKIDEFLLNPVRYNKHRAFYQKITKEQLQQYNYFENIDIDNENIRNSILNNTYTDIINNINQDIKKDLDKDIPKPNPCCLCCGKCFTNCCCCCKSKT